MKKHLSILLIAAIVLSGITSINTQKAIAEPQDERGYVSVSTSANTELAPDVAELSISIVTEDVKSLQKAAQDNKEVSDKIYEELSALIDKTKGDYIKTANYHASPVYSYKNNKKTIVNYKASNNILVRTKNIQDASKMIDKSLMLGATNINSINFAISNYDKQCNDLLILAGKKAHARAAALAASSNGLLTGIKTMHGSCSSSNSNAEKRLYAANYSADTASGSEETYTPIKPGIIKINANLNASYFVK